MPVRLFGNWFRNSSRGRVLPQRPLQGLRLEWLERRDAPAAGAIDSTFGFAGFAKTTIGTTSVASDIAIDKSGRVIVVGFGKVNGINDFALARYTPGGELDSEFGVNGVVSAVLGKDSYAQAVVIDGAGRIVVAGYAAGDFALARFDSSGSLDSNFGVNGVTLTQVGGIDEAHALVIDSSNRIVVAGVTQISEFDRRFAIARYTDDGKLDSAFGTVVTAIGNGFADANAVGIDDVGRIVVAGRTLNSSAGNSFALARYSEMGVLDNSFGQGGIITTGVEGYDSIASLALVASNIVVGGATGNGQHFAVARYDQFGNLDPTFNSGKVAVTQAAGHGCNGVVVDSAGRIVAAGESALVRYLDDGTLDPTFGAGGIVDVNQNHSLATASACLIQPDGRIVIGGSVILAPGFDQFVVERFQANNPPHVSLADGYLTHTEDSPAIFVDSGTTLTDDADVSLVGVTIRIDNYVRNEDVLGYGTLPSGIAASFDDGLGTLSFSGQAPLSDYQTLLRSLTFANASQSPSELTRTITITANDGDLLDGLGSDSRQIVVRAVNDAPSFSDDAVLPVILQATTEPPGRKLSALFGGLFADPDSGDSLSGVAVVGNAASAALGKWQYSTDNGTFWFDVGIADGASALALSAATRVRFKPETGFSGEPTPLLVRPLDSTCAGAFSDGATRHVVDTSTNGGTTPIGVSISGIDTLIIPLTPSNNSLPKLFGVPPTVTLFGGQKLSFQASASDADMNQSLTFSLAGAPSGASIDPVSGQFAWAPSAGERPNVFTFLVRVADNGVPVKSDTQVITVALVGAGMFGGDLVVGGTLGNDVIGVNLATDPDFAQVLINGDSQGLFPLSSIAKVIVRGWDGNDKITIAAKIGKPAELIGGLGNDTVTGGAGDDVLEGGPGKDVLVGGAGGDTYRFGDDWGVDTITELAAGGSDRFDFSGVTAGVNFIRGSSLIAQSGTNKATGSNIESLLGGSGSDMLTSTSGTNAWAINSANAGTLNGSFSFSGIENLTGSGGADTFTLANGVTLSGTIAGGAGVNTLNYAAWTTGVTVNLAAGTATGVGGNVAGITKVAGGSGSDTLIGPNKATTWSISGANAGKAGAVSFASVENLIGGSLADAFVFAKSGSVAGTIDGGLGIDALNYAAFTAAVRVNLALGTATATGGVSGIENATGGSGADILVGNALANLLLGGSGRDLLIGGDGGDNLQGGAGDDILVASRTDHDSSPAALEAIMAEWSSANAYALRVDHIFGAVGGGLNGGMLLNAGTIHDDAAADTLLGNGDTDWFIKHLGDTSADRTASERLTSL